MGNHQLVPSARVHSAVRKYFANAAARTGDTDTYTSDERGCLAVQTDTGELYFLDVPTGPTWTAVGANPVGSGTDNALARYDGTTAIQSSGITVDDSDNLTGVGSVSMAHAANDTTAALTIDRSPSASAAAVGVALTMGANATGAAISITNSGTGFDIDTASGTLDVGARLGIPSGGAGEQGLYFTDATTTGIRKGSGNEVDVYTAGTLRFRIGSGTSSLHYGNFRPDSTGAQRQLGISGASWGKLFVSNTAADTTPAVTLDRSPSSSAAGVGIDLTMGVNATGAAISITNSGTGASIDAGGDIAIPAESGLYFDGVGGNDYITQSSGIAFRFYVGGTERFRLNGGSVNLGGALSPITASTLSVGTAASPFGAAYFTSTGATTTPGITVDRSPSSSAAAPVLDLTAGVNNTGAVINITNSGTGRSIDAGGDVLLGSGNRLEFRSTEFMSAGSSVWDFVLNSSMRLRYTYIGNIWSFQGSEVRPHLDEVCQLGSASFGWKALYVSNTDADTEPGVTINRAPSTSAAAPVLDLTAGANNTGAVINITNSGTGESITAGGDISVPTGSKLIIDGAGGNDYIYQAAGNTMLFFLGGVQYANLSSSAFNINVSGTAAGPALRFAGDDVGLYRPGANQIGMCAGGVDGIEVDNSTTAGETRLLVYDVDNATVERVSVGAADSGGTNYKVLRIPN